MYMLLLKNRRFHKGINNYTLILGIYNTHHAFDQFFWSKKLSLIPLILGPIIAWKASPMIWDGASSKDMLLNVLSTTAISPSLKENHRIARNFAGIFP